MKDYQIDLDDQNTLYLKVFENKILACVNGGLNHLIATTEIPVEIPVKLEVINKDVAKVTWGCNSVSYLGISGETITAWKDEGRKEMNNIDFEKLIASLCYMSGKSPREIVEICQELPYDLSDIQAYYRMYGEFPE